MKLLLIFTFSLIKLAYCQSNLTWYEVFTEKIEKNDNPEPVRCYGIYGCFPITKPWACKERASNVFPFSPEIIEVKFPLFTNFTRKSPIMIDLDNLEKIHFANVSKKSSFYFISHGFLELGNSPWMIKMMNEILNYDNEAVVILVDWRGGSSMPYYQAAANIRVVGAVLAHLIAGIFLELKMENLDKFHLIGHSLGEN
ncbi:hypothetical protein PVAND_016968 [Polypedilum vanderplanki]|uniref:Lipase domain-containing protein n=1 Tax=Polypedilum vanderplanki TaxID=319348 RepID=A0A9J6BGT9_POLVA|nr:hypothetical protein PVAND_016968 [Polypedilum vanderplanki]